MGKYKNNIISSQIYYIVPRIIAIENGFIGSQAHNSKNDESVNIDIDNLTSHSIVLDRKRSLQKCLSVHPTHENMCCYISENKTQNQIDIDSHRL